MIFDYFLDKHGKSKKNSKGEAQQILSTNNLNTTNTTAQINQLTTQSVSSQRSLSPMSRHQSQLLITHNKQVKNPPMSPKKGLDV